MWEGGNLSHAWEVVREVLEECDEHVSDPPFCCGGGAADSSPSQPFYEAFSHTSQCTSGVQSPALAHAVALQGHSELILLLLLPPH